MVADSLFIDRDADFSPCDTWRYTLKRKWDRSKFSALFILLNPSTADQHHDDPTNRRGIQYAMDWGYGGVTFCNLFAFRTPYPKELKKAQDPVGPENDEYIIKEVERAGQVVLAWGAHGSWRDRDREVTLMLKRRCPKVPLYAMGGTMTKGNQPRHILYLKRTLKPERLIIYE